ncbi:hypothetical protein N7414_15745 [Pseudomonas sp. GD04087]|uniref:hypothetical protein n=1 Tax=unclassified Pseudomonas TaxID=196821 RepID=UPI00244AA97A|nr:MULTISPECIES: hypothetical protein [unclassified Pseudomonas]MDH0290577.1 hypothetical protein [Pseudomonas sp. GD04087]MDH1051494.1 hypothetical protein [Pseudomonas sp. GD03903]MDH2003072.1 hypothetical protein [Pseudomonas sp. GD03691]
MINGNLGSFFDGFEVSYWPPETVKVPRARQEAMISQLPVSAAPRAIQAQAARSYVGDYYDRVHIVPVRLDLGNVVSTQVTTIQVWNAWRVARTLEDITGTDPGLQVSGQSEPPVLFKALKELSWQLSVTPDGQPVLDASVAWVFDNDEQPAVRVTANRIIAWSFAPDWGDSVIERLSALTDVLQSESGAEQRRALRLAPRREFEAQMYAEDRERQLLDLALYGWSGRIWAMPVWPDVQLLTQPVAAGALRINCSTAYLDFVQGGMVMLRGESAFNYEVVQVKAIDSTGLDLLRPTQQAWRRGTRLYPARGAQLMEQPSLTRLTDRAQGAKVHFLVMEACYWPEVLPSTQYRGRPVLEERPDESEDLTSTVERIQLQLDSALAMPRVTELADRPFPVTGYRWLDLGRARRSAWRSLVHGLRGRQTAVWVPTHADDLTLVNQVNDLSTTMDVTNVGYTRFASARPGRRDIRIELRDGSVFHRRILNSTELDSETERLAIDVSLGRLVLPSQVSRICWMALSRGSSDVVEIEHITDSEGLASSAITFRGVPDDEL